MRMFCLIPVHNRLTSTKQCINDLCAQKFEGELEIVVVDDGSTDGTREFLQQSQLSLCGSTQLTILNGDGQWWWSRSINEAIEHIISGLSPDDGVLFLNDDVRICNNYVNKLLEVWHEAGPQIVISQLVTITTPHELIPSRVFLDSKRLEITPHVPKGRKSIVNQWSDLAPGRGTLYPAAVFHGGLRIDAQRLPHYLADYEFSLRAKHLGFQILLAEEAKVFSDISWGNRPKKTGIVWRLFAKESPDRLYAYWSFWRTFYGRKNNVVLLSRLLRYRIAPAVVGRFFDHWMKR